jgi:hypothetical protein
VNYGINGQITDTLTGEPVKAKVNVFLHDFDNSFVYSRLPEGWYYRPIDAGNYTLTFTAQGYYAKSVSNVTVTQRNTTRLDVQMVPLTIGGLDERKGASISFYPNPAQERTRIFLPGITTVASLEVFNILGISVSKMEIIPDQSHSAFLDLSSLAKGIYLVRVNERNTVHEGKLIVR